MISYLQCAVEYLNAKSGYITAIAQTNQVGDFKEYSSLAHIVYNCFIISMLYVLIPQYLTYKC